MNIQSEQEMLEFGRNYAKKLTRPAIIELVGDVGVGKTTFTRGLAEGLGVREVVTSPSYVISKTYGLPDGGRLIHYDFYRLPEPGLMISDLEEAINDSGNIIVIEWGESVADILPKKHHKIEIRYNEKGREVII